MTVLRIEERFVVGAPPERVWRFLVDPRQVVACVPGGELDDVADERTFHGRIRIRIGPWTLAYRGRVRLAEVDEAARHVTIVGEAREGAGSGSARLTLRSMLAPLPGSRTAVAADARVDVAGRAVELGRGALEALGHVVFQDFAGRVCAAIEAREAGRAPARGEDALRAVPLLWRAIAAWVGRRFPRPAPARTTPP